MISVHFQDKPFNITVIEVYAPTSNAKEAEVQQFYEDLPTGPFITNTPKRCPFHHRTLGSQEIPGVTGKFGFGVQNEAGQRLTEFGQENALVIANTLFQQHKRRLYTWTSQMVNTEIKLIIFLAAKDGEAPYSQQKQDWELTMAQIINFLLPHSESN